MLLRHHHILHTSFRFLTQLCDCDLDYIVIYNLDDRLFVVINVTPLVALPVEPFEPRGVGEQRLDVLQ